MEALKFDKKQLANYRAVGEFPDRILPLGKLNIFVGTNNSGKSRLLRGILATENLAYLPHDPEYGKLQAIARKIKEPLLEILNGSTFEDITPHGAPGNISMRQSLEQIAPEVFLGEEPGLVSSLQRAYQVVKASVEGHGYSGRRSRSGGKPILYQDDRRAFVAMFETIEPYQKFINDGLRNSSTSKFARVYVPVLRGLRPALETAEDIYKSRTLGDYFLDKEKNLIHSDLQVFTGLSLYEEIRKHLLGSLAERKLIADYEKYLSDRFFEGKPVTLIPKIDRDVLVIKIGSEFEKEIFNLGDGLQSLIAITFPIFRLAKENGNEQAIVCIEEPELLIHPGLQRTLMNELVGNSQYENIQFFVTTHSNHFLDLTLDYNDVSIFRVLKELPETKTEEVTPKFVVENVSNKDKQTLELLGVKNSSVFLANATVWVEGITDRMYLSRALELEQDILDKDARKYREDDHYAFVEYGGANISHWDFIEEEDVDQVPLESIVSKIFLIADNDADAVDANGKQIRGKRNKKQERLRAIHAHFGDERFVQLDRREIENLIPTDVLRRVVTRLGAQNAENVSLRYSEYKNARMGSFIEEKFGLTGFANKYGAIKDKKKFAETVLEEMDSIESLSSEMRSVAQKILAFIAASN